MNASEKLMIAKGQWDKHHELCGKCQRYTGNTGDLGFLCYDGTKLFIAMKEAGQEADKNRRSK